MLSQQLQSCWPCSTPSGCTPIPLQAAARASLSKMQIGLSLSIAESSQSLRISCSTKLSSLASRTMPPVARSQMIIAALPSFPLLAAHKVCLQRQTTGNWWPSERIFRWDYAGPFARTLPLPASPNRPWLTLNSPLSPQILGRLKQESHLMLTCIKIGPNLVIFQSSNQSSPLWSLSSPLSF